MKNEKWNMKNGKWNMENKNGKMEKWKNEKWNMKKEKKKNVKLDDGKGNNSVFMMKLKASSFFSSWIYIVLMEMENGNMKNVKCKM